MAVLPFTELGQGPDLVLLHGVGAGPESFAEVAGLLAADHRVLVVERPGDGDGAVALDDQVAGLSSTMAAHTRHPIVVGVSGGATLALALAVGQPDLVGALVLHEPLVGRHAPALDARFRVIAADAAKGDAEALDAVIGVLGGAWSRLADEARAVVSARAGWARLEIPLFASFDPSADELRSLSALPVLTTIGAESGPERRAAADVLADLAGAEVVVVPRAGNAVQIDAPGDFAAVIRAWRPTPIGCGG